MPPTKSAEAKKDAELTTKDTGRPSREVTRPPSAAPDVSAKDQVAEDRALAGRISSVLAMSGSRALRAGSKIEAKMTSRPSRA